MLDVNLQPEFAGRNVSHSRLKWIGRRMLTWHRREEGLVMWVSLVAIVFFLILMALVGNIGIVINGKIKTQNTADAVAYSSATTMARGMNAITASNHVIGELTALYVLHHALGGWHLDKYGDENSGIVTKGLNLAIKIGNKALKLVGWTGGPVSDSDDAEAVTPDPRSDEESTLYPAMIVLKTKMLAAYWEHYKGFKISKNPKTHSAGIAKMRAAKRKEAAIAKEYNLLREDIEQKALDLRKAKAMIPRLIDAIYKYQHSIVRHATRQMTKTANFIGQENEQVGKLGLTDGQQANALPVEIEGTNSVDRSQLMRATYPWVRHWRIPLLCVFIDEAPLSAAATFFVKYTTQYTTEVCEVFLEPSRAGGSSLVHFPMSRIRMLVMRDLNASGSVKGAEMWTFPNRNDRAEELFTIMGFAREKNRPSVFAKPFFRQSNPDGIVCFSQAMIYNANAQQSSGGDKSQPRVGWDTLNWKFRNDNILEYKKSLVSSIPRLAIMGATIFFEKQKFEKWMIALDVYDATSALKNKPEVQINWQAKLVPVTQSKLKSSITIKDDEMTKVYWNRLRPNSNLKKSLYTH